MYTTRARDCQCRFSNFIATVRFSVQHLHQQMDHVNLFSTFRERSIAEDMVRDLGMLKPYWMRAVHSQYSGQPENSLFSIPADKNIFKLGDIPTNNEMYSPKPLCFFYLGTDQIEVITPQPAHLFVVVLLPSGRFWGQPRYPSAHEWIGLCSIYTV